MKVAQNLLRMKKWRYYITLILFRNATFWLARTQKPNGNAV